MSTPKGYPSQGKNERVFQEFTTVQPLGSGRYGMDVCASIGVAQISTANAITAVLKDEQGLVIGITKAAHGAKVGDVVKFTSGNANTREPRVVKVVDANNFHIGESLAAADAPAATNTYDLLRPTQATISTSGAIATTPGPVQFVLNGVDTEVLEDTAVPANNRPLPVKLVGVTGTLNVTAGDLNVQTTHVGANFDSQRIGDGTDLLAVNADGSINSVVTATNLDIRDLSHTADSVKVGDGTDLMAVNADGSINAVVTATALDIRPLDQSTDSILVIGTDFDIRNLSSATDSILVDGANFDIRALDDSTDSVTAIIAGSVVVTATDLDIRGLVAATDSVAIGDGSDLMTVNADGSINTVVTATNLDIRDLTHVSDSVKVGDGTDLLAVNTDGSINVSVNAESVVDLLDTPILAGSSINASAGALVQVVASTAAITKKIQVSDTTGDFLGWYTGAAASEVLRAITGPGFDGILPFSFAASTRVTVRGMQATVSGAGFVSVNFIG